MRVFSKTLPCGANATVSYFGREEPEEGIGEDEPSKGVFRIVVEDGWNEENNVTVFISKKALRRIGTLLARLQKIAAKEM